jgi:hypothetical protein
LNQSQLHGQAITLTRVGGNDFIPALTMEIRMAKKAAKKKTAKFKKSGESAKSSKKAKAPTRNPWTAADMKALKTLVKQNTPTRLIAMKLKRSVASVYNKVSTAGISLAPANRSPRD